MKTIQRYLTLALVAGSFAIVPAAFAGDCCAKTAAATKEGKACEMCVKDQCCKDAAKAVAKAGEAKPCGMCATKKGAPGA